MKPQKFQESCCHFLMAYFEVLKKEGSPETSPTLVLWKCQPEHFFFHVASQHHLLSVQAFVDGIWIENTKDKHFHIMVFLKSCSLPVGPRHFLSFSIPGRVPQVTFPGTLPVGQRALWKMGLVQKRRIHLGTSFSSLPLFSRSLSSFLAAFAGHCCCRWESMWHKS